MGRARGPRSAPVTVGGAGRGEADTEPGREASLDGPRPGPSDGHRIGVGRAGSKEGRRGWAAILLAYLVVTLPLAVAGAWVGAPRWPLLLPLHLLLGGWCVVLVRGRPPETAWLGGLADWTSLLALPFLYAELPLLMAGVPGPLAYGDPAVIDLEEALFGVQPAFEWAGALPSVAVSELLHLAYLSYYALIFLPPLLLWLGRTGPDDRADRRRAFHRTVLALTLAMLPAFLVMVAWPVQGPRYLGVPAGVPDGPVRGLVLAILEAGSSRGAAFPSSHVSLAVAQSVVALRWQPRVGLVVAVITVLLAAGAVYGGFHYGVDVAAGAILGGAAGAVAVTGWRGAPDGAGRGHPPASTDLPGEGETPPPDRG